jgi:hypothetical protein
VKTAIGVNIARFEIWNIISQPIELFALWGTQGPKTTSMCSSALKVNENNELGEEWQCQLFFLPLRGVEAF